MKTIVHFHIFKNAGTSVSFALRDIFKENFSILEGQHAHDILNINHLNEFLQKNRNVFCVSSHLLKPYGLNSNILPIIFFNRLI
jgi:hypothetical protein